MSTRTITDTSDTIYTQIITSSGGVYAATFAGLQAAIYSLNTTGGRVDVPVCNISLTGSLFVKNNTKLIGTGNMTIFFAAANMNHHMLIINMSHDVEIASISFNGNNFSQTESQSSGQYAGNLSGICMKGDNFVYIHDCSFYNTVSNCIFSYYTVQSHNITVENCKIYRHEKHVWTAGSGTGGIYFSGNDCKALYNYIENTWGTGITAHGSTYTSPSPRRVQIIGNTITGEIGHGIHCEWVNSSTIRGNFIYNLNSTCYNGFDIGAGRIWSSGIICGGWNNTITENNVYNVSYMGIGGQGVNAIGRNIISNNYIEKIQNSTYGYGIYVEYNNTVTGNMIKNSAKYGIHIAGNNNTIDNNILSMCYVAIYNNQKTGIIIKGNTITASTDYSIYMVGGKSIISGNTISYSGDHAIYCSGGSDIDNNYIYATTGTAINCPIGTARSQISVCNNWINKTSVAGIIVESSTAGANISGVIISNNNINGTLNDGIRLEDAQNCTVSGNIIISKGVAVQGIDLLTVKHSIFVANRIYGFNQGIYERPLCNFNIIVANNCLGCTTPIDVTGTNTTTWIYGGWRYGFNFGTIS